LRTASIPQAEDLAVVNRWATRPVGGAALRLQAGQLKLSPAPADGAALLTVVARDGVDVLTGPLAGRLRECARDDCALLFVDKSRAGARRWCSMEACGTQSKMSAYRRRRGSGAVT
jgi:predicted RNA-binding Zn ribbon-like protein